MSKDERGDDEWLGRPDHPLLNNVILSTVFKSLRNKDLKECRLVCKTWNVSTIPYTRDAFPITIYGKPPKFDNNCKRMTKNFVEDFRSNKLGIPFGRFELGTFCPTDGVGQEFLQLCGDATKEIEFIEDDYVIEDLSEILKSTPNLETLIIPKNLRSRSGNVIELFPGPEDSKPKLSCVKELHIYFDNREERNTFCPTFLDELFTAAKNISNVHLMDSIELNEEMEEYNQGSSLDVLGLIEKLGRESSIQELFLVHERSDDSEYIELLRRMAVKPDGLKLKTLHYEPTSSDQETHGLFQLVSLFKNTLEDLEIEGNSIACFNEFLKMSRLARLSVKLPDDFSSKCVNLNKVFPVLTQLELFHDDDRSDYELDEFFPDSEPCLKMNGFFSNIILHINGINQMLNVFPHLTKLSFEVGEDGAEVLRQIWSQMAQLNHLNIGGTLQSMDSVDSVLTGISSDALQEISDTVTLEDIEETTELQRGETIMNLLSQYSHLPSIRNLTHLKSLYLSLTGLTPDWSYEGGLTNLTGYLGLYSMQHLQHLEVKNCEFTKTCCEILTKDMGLQSWAFIAWQGGMISDIIPPEES